MLCTELLWLVQSFVRGASDLAYASQPQAATIKPGAKGFAVATFAHWPSGQLRGKISPAAVSSPNLREDLHEGNGDHDDRCYRTSCSHRISSGTVARIERAAASCASSGSAMVEFASSSVLGGQSSDRE